ncbi:MAG: oligosaccharide flippase family protein [Bacteroidia bacterium]|nr:oligosaccharide flippase family protein [Bacteroidia bacterium]
MMGNAVTAALGFLTFFVLVRSLEQDSFGEWVLFITAATLVDLLRFGITRVALTRFLSGAKPDERKHFIGSSWLIGLLSILAMAVILYLLVMLFPETIKNSGFNLFFIWYVPLALSNLPWGNATSILQADEEFDKILLVRFINTGSFLLFLVLNYYLWKVSVEWIVIWNIITNVLTSLLCTAFNWDGSWYIFHARRYTTKITLNFGKYSMGTSIGSSLLKSADTFIIGLSPFLGTTGVALYSIPIKFTEAVEIIIRSFGATSFPKLSKASIDGNITEFRKIFYQYSGFLTYLMIPVAIVSAFFAKDFVMILGGKQYEDAADGLAIIMQMFIIFSMILPIDRFTGIGLDAVNKPDKNFYKTLIMTSTNIVGDIIAVFLLHWLFPSLSVITILIFISIGSIGFEVIGVIFGIYYLNKEIPLKFFTIFTEGFVVYKDLYKKALDFIKK